MIKKRERLSRLIGLGSSNKRLHQGGIEHLMPGRITGWIVSKVDPFHEVRLLVGTHLIARAEVNQPRQDVSEKLNYSGNPGFSLQLPSFLPSLDWNQPARLLALSVDGSHQAELQLLNESAQTRERLQQLLQSDALGIEGHFDGIVDGALQGWAARRDQHHPVQIWLQCDKYDPIPLVCDQLREGMGSVGVSSRCGFRMSINELPSKWRGRGLRCTFDQQGMFNLPQNQPISVPLESSVEVIRSAGVGEDDSHASGAMGSSDEIKAHWRELEMFSLILDEIESKLDNRDLIAAQQMLSAKKKGWFRRVLDACRS